MAKPQTQRCPKCSEAMTLSGEFQDVQAPASPTAGGSDEAVSVQTWTCPSCGTTVERAVNVGPVDDTGVTDTDLQRRGPP